MSKILTTSTLAAALAIAAIADAQAWQRNGSFSGPRGTSTLNATGNCEGKVCTRDVTTSGAQGRTMTRQGSAGCADGKCEGSRTTTGPGGQAFTRQGSISR